MNGDTRRLPRRVVLLAALAGALVAPATAVGTNWHYFSGTMGVGGSYNTIQAGQTARPRDWSSVYFATSGESTYYQTRLQYTGGWGDDAAGTYSGSVSVSSSHPTSNSTASCNRAFGGSGYRTTNCWTTY